MNVEPLLRRAMLDPFALVDRVLQKVLDQLEREGALAGYDNMPPEELIATALGNWLTGMLASGRPPDVVEVPADGDRAAQSTRDDELVERNSALAAAVGACDCWGEQADCPFCDGDGSAGWVRPDKQLFARYVYPAVRKLRISNAMANGARRPTGHQMTEPHGKENGDG